MRGCQQWENRGKNDAPSINLQNVCNGEKFNEGGTQRNVMPVRIQCNERESNRWRWVEE
jgi:hypothetical protein